MIKGAVAKGPKKRKTMELAKAGSMVFCCVV